MPAQEVHFARSVDGVQLAWARHGHGPPLIRVATWMTHIQHDWESPIWRHWLDDLGARFTLLRYDERGCGLSDREPPELTLDHWVEDVEAVARSAGLDRFALLGMSQAGAIATAYAARHPEQVTHLILYGAYGRGQLRRGNPQAEQNVQLSESVIRLGWGRSDPAFRRVFTSRFVRDGTEEQLRWFDALEQRSASPEIAALLYRARAEVDVSAIAPRVQAPTLALHADQDEAVPFEEGRLLASLIPGSSFVALHGHNHILLATEPAWPEFLSAVDPFMGFKAGRRQETTALPATITPRELEVLELVAQGYTNQEIAEQLYLSIRTIERHLGHIYSALGLTGRSARAAAVARLPHLKTSNGG